MKKKLYEIITQIKEEVTKSSLKQIESIASSILAMTGRVTMLGISRWNDAISYKTIERFFDKKLNWLSINYQIIKPKLGKNVILVADECTISKSGKSTHNLGYFYSGLQNRAIKSIQILSFALVDVDSRKSYPIFSKQLKQSKKKTVTKTKNKKAGRPQGSKNKNSSEIKLTKLFRIVSWYLNIIIKTIKIPNLRYFVYDGAFGNNVGIQVAKRSKLHLISKLKKNSELYLKFTGVQKSRGRKRIYGYKIDYNNLNTKDLKETKIDGDNELKFYQIEVLNKKIHGAVNAIIIVAKKLSTNQQTHKIIFSSDLNQDYKEIIDYYSLRFQIEFNFRDAKQYFGLEDFMNIKKRRVHNFANLSMFMNNVSYSLHTNSKFLKYSVNDIKSLFRAEKYTREVLKLYGAKVDDILINEAIWRVSAFSMIHGDVA
jgi:putative transposase